MTIEVQGMGLYSIDSVLFDAYAAFPEESSSPGLIIVTVPTELTELNRMPTVFVRFKDRSPLKYQGEFSVIPKTESTEEVLDILRWASENPNLALGYVVLIVILFSVTPVMLVYVYRVRSLRYKSSNYEVAVRHESVPEESFEKLTEPPIKLPPPTVPKALAKAVAEGECVFFAGAGLSAQSGLPVWNGMLREVIDRSTDASLISPSAASSLNRLLRRGENEDAADGLVSVLGPDIGTALSVIGDILNNSGAKPSDAHKELARLPVSALLTTNFDDLLERAFEDRHPAVYTPRQAEDCLDALSQDRFFLLKLSGVLDDPRNAILAPKQHADMVKESQIFDTLLDRLFLTRTMFFIGVSLDGIEEFFRGTSASFGVSNRHFALVAADDESWEIKARTLQSRYGVEVLPFSLAERDTVLREFLQELSRRTADALVGIDANDLREMRASNSRLARVELTNIGPFESLELDLHREWNLLLGDNGVGKSTVLKAIAVGLCGDAANPWAGRIIKVGESSAEVILRTDTGKTYRTKLRRRSDGGTEFESRPTTPLAAEGWLALGFPALRTVSWERPRTESSLGMARPVAADLLPVIIEGADPRLDGLKQRIVTLDHQRKTEAIEGSGEGRYDRLMKDLLKIFEDVLEGMPIEMVLQWFTGLAAGVAYLHDHGIVHRDLKPANIFLDNHTVKIGDYGLSKFISCSRRSGQTESVGTVHYMAPEIANGRYGKEIDTYALGIILYEMLTGHVPFEGESVGEVLMKHLTAEPDLSALAEPYRGLVRSAMAKDPDARFTSVTEMVRRLPQTDGQQFSESVDNSPLLKSGAVPTPGPATSEEPILASLQEGWQQARTNIRQYNMHPLLKSVLGFVIVIGLVATSPSWLSTFMLVGFCYLVYRAIRSLVIKPQTASSTGVTPTVQRAAPAGTPGADAAPPEGRRKWHQPRRRRSSWQQHLRQH
ncbi:MAG: protein kinase, partial [Planctomycetes bacterium]|nr:protein kinase [Planctomycetota bacterium]